MLGRLLNTAAASLTPASHSSTTTTSTSTTNNNNNQNNQNNPANTIHQYLESVTEEEHTAGLLFPDAPPTTPSTSTCYSPHASLATSFDDRGAWADLEPFRDFRLVVAQDALGDRDDPCVLFDSAKSARNGNAANAGVAATAGGGGGGGGGGVGADLRKVATQPTDGRMGDRRRSSVQSVQSQRRPSAGLTSLATHAPGPRPSALFAAGRRNAPLSQAKDPSETPAANTTAVPTPVPASSSYSSDDSLLNCIFGSNAFAYRNSSTKMHILPPDQAALLADDARTSSHSSHQNPPFSRQRAPTASSSHSTNTIGSLHGSPPSAPGPSSSNKNAKVCVMITRMFSVNLPSPSTTLTPTTATETATPTATTPLPPPPPPPRHRDKKTPMFAVAIIVKLPVVNNESAYNLNRRASANPSSGKKQQSGTAATSTATTGAVNTPALSRKATTGFGVGEMPMFLGSSLDSEHRLEAQIAAQQQQGNKDGSNGAAPDTGSGIGIGLRKSSTSQPFPSLPQTNTAPASSFTSPPSPPPPAFPTMDDRIDMLVDHIDAIHRALAHFESVASKEIFAMLSKRAVGMQTIQDQQDQRHRILHQQNMQARQQQQQQQGGKAAQTKSPQQPHLRILPPMPRPRTLIVTLPPGALSPSFAAADGGKNAVSSQASSNLLAVRDEAARTIRRICTALRIPRVPTGQARWGVWRDEARWIARALTARTNDPRATNRRRKSLSFNLAAAPTPAQQGRDHQFFHVLITAFLGNHTEWITQFLGPDWRKMRRWWAAHREMPPQLWWAQHAHQHQQRDQHGQSQGHSHGAGQGTKPPSESPPSLSSWFLEREEQQKQYAQLQAQAQHRRSRGEEIVPITNRTVIVSPDKMMSRRLIFVLSSFLPMQNQQKTAAQQQQAQQRAGTGFYGQDGDGLFDGGADSGGRHGPGLNEGYGLEALHAQAQAQQQAQQQSSRSSLDHERKHEESPPMLGWMLKQQQQRDLQQQLAENSRRRPQARRGSTQAQHVHNHTHTHTHTHSHQHQQRYGRPALANIAWMKHETTPKPPSPATVATNASVAAATVACAAPEATVPVPHFARHSSVSSSSGGNGSNGNFNALGIAVGGGNKGGNGKSTSWGSSQTSGVTSPPTGPTEDLEDESAGSIASQNLLRTLRSSEVAAATRKDTRAGGAGKVGAAGENGRGTAGAGNRHKRWDSFLSFWNSNSNMPAVSEGERGGEGRGQQQQKGADLDAGRKASAVTPTPAREYERAQRRASLELSRVPEGPASSTSNPVAPEALAFRPKTLAQDMQLPSTPTGPAPAPVATQQNTAEQPNLPASFDSKSSSNQTTSPIKISNCEDGIVDVELPLPGFVSLSSSADSHLISPLRNHQQYRSRPRASVTSITTAPEAFCSNCKSLEAGGNAGSMKSTTSNAWCCPSATTTTSNMNPFAATPAVVNEYMQKYYDELYINVAGWLKRFHEDFVLQAVRPYAELEADIRRAMSAEPTPGYLQLNIVGQEEGGDSDKRDSWTDVCTTLIADARQFNVKQLRLQRRLRAKSDPASSPAATSLEIEERFLEEPVVEVDNTFVEAVDRVLARSGHSPLMNSTTAPLGSTPPAATSTAHNRRNSAATTATGAGARERHRSSTLYSINDRPSSADDRVPLFNQQQATGGIGGTETPYTRLFEVPRGECSRLVLGALEEVVRSVTAERRSEEENAAGGIAIPSTTGPAPTATKPAAEAATKGAAGGKKGTSQENTLREGIRKWLSEVEDSV